MKIAGRDTIHFFSLTRQKAWSGIHLSVPASLRVWLSGGVVRARLARKPRGRHRENRSLHHAVILPVLLPRAQTG